MRRRARWAAWICGLLAGAGAAAPQTLSILDATLTEGDFGTRNAAFTVSLSGVTPLVVTVDYATRDGTATAAGGDYLPATGTLVFTGNQPQEIVVQVQGDLEVEPDETFSVLLTNPINAAIADGEGIGTILNDDRAPEPSIDDSTVTEGDSGIVAAVFLVRLSAPAAAPITFGFATRDGTATAGSDYRATAGSLTFLAGEAARTLAVEVFGDTVFEPDETFTVELTGAAGVVLDDALGTIRDDDPEPALSIGSVAVMEGDAGTVDALFAVDLLGDPAGPVTVDYATRDGTATAADGDYRSVSGTLTFEPGDRRLDLSVPVHGDTRLEPDETFFVELSNPRGATVADGRGEGTILNDDQAPPRLSIDDVSVVEGDAGASPARLTVRLSEAARTAVRVGVASRDGTATAADGDYRPTSGTLTFEPGQTRREVAVEVVGDPRVEPDETFFVELRDPEGATLADGVAEVVIVNDDEEPSRIRLAGAPPVMEGAGTAAVAVERFGGASRAARVTLAARSGTAAAGDDFTAATRVIEWAAGETGRKTFELEILDDNLTEDDETVLLSLSNAVGSEIGEPARLALLILDDDTPMALAPVGDPEITVDVNQELELRVRVARDDGTAVEGAVVVWSLEGDAELLDGERTPTDAEGLATQRLRLGARPGAVRVTATIEGTGRSVTFEVAVESALSDRVDPADPGETAVANALDVACRQATGDFDALCDYLFALADPAEQRQAIAELAPEEVAAQGQLSLGAQRLQLGNVGARLAALRGGGSRHAVDQLAVVIRGHRLGLGRIPARAGVRHAGARLAERLDAALAIASGGGGDEDAGPADAGTPDAPDAGAEPTALSRLGFFASGQISLGDRPTTPRETGFDFETLGLTVGVDYRLSDRFVLGAAAGYLDTDTDLVADGGSLDATGTSLSAYATYYVDKLYLDAVASYGRQDFDLVRHVDLPQPFQGRRRHSASGSPEGRQLSLSLGGGYDAQLRALSLGGFGRLSYVDAEIDGYVERGAGPFNLAVGAQDLESVLAEAGLEVAWAASRSWGVLRPTARFAYLHEFEDDVRLIRSRFVEDVTATELLIPTERPDRDFFNLTAGVTALLPRGRTIYFIYDTDLARDDLDVHTFTLGLRLEL